MRFGGVAPLLMPAGAPLLPSLHPMVYEVPKSASKAALIPSLSTFACTRVAVTRSPRSTFVRSWRSSSWNTATHRASRKRPSAPTYQAVSRMRVLVNMWRES